MTDIADRLQVLIDLLGFTQKQFAQVLRKTPPTINRWFTRERQPGANSCLTISSLTGCNLEWLEKGKGPIFPTGERELTKLEFAQIGLKILSGEDWRSAFTMPPETAEATSETAYGEFAATQEFKKLCAANFDHVFEYIKETLGTESIDIQIFLDELLEVHHPFRVWLHEKKLERKNNKAGDNKNTPKKLTM